ncbi:MAG: hypothetical protein QW478_04205 [Candidatus Micrarchaeaceae archaeon]
MSEQEIKQMEQIGQEIQSVEEVPEESGVSHITPHMLATALQPLSRMISRKTGLKSVELTDEDVSDLEKALEPLDLSMLERVSRYLPIVIFGIGYLLRIILEFREKRQVIETPPQPLPKTTDNPVTQNESGNRPIS